MDLVGGDRGRGVLQINKRRRSMKGECDCSYDAWERETVNDRAREFKRHGVCWLAGWTEGERKYVTAERDKCGRTNRWWLTGSFIHYCDQIQQDSPPYGMAQLIHLITWTTYRTRGGEGVFCVCVCTWTRRCLKVFWIWQQIKRKWGEQVYNKDCN